MADKLTQAQIHTLVCTSRKAEYKDRISSWESPQAIKRAELLRTIEARKEELALQRELKEMGFSYD